MTSKSVSQTLTIGENTFLWGSRTFVMGIVNASPDSFSGDGVSDVNSAVALGLRLEAEGADILDIGGQSTRPGFAEIDAAEEIDRVVPVIEGLRRKARTPISIDTYRVRVAEAALASGAAIVNDINGFRAEPALADLVAQRDVAAVLMHNQRERPFRDVIGDITAGWEESLRIAAAAGVPGQRIILDPGFGFGWTLAQNLQMLRRLGELRSFGLPLLVGTSRKSTIGAVLDAGTEDRIFGTAATVALAIAQGADIVRVHDVREMAQVCRMTDAIVRSS